MSPDADLVAELMDLRQRVERLESESSLHALRNRFHEFVNTDRWDEIGGLFAEDAVLDCSYLGSASGRAEITAFFAAIPRLLPAAEGRPFVRQFIHGHDVEVDGDTAHGTSFLLATPIYHGESFLLAGRFTDTYVRRGEVWSFASVTLDVDYSVPIHEGWAGEDQHRMRL